MKNTKDEILENLPPGAGQIAAYYQKGLMYSAEAIVLSYRPSKRKKERAYDDSEILDYQNLAREQLLLALSQTGTCEEQVIKIKAALLLVKLSQTPSEEAKQYFYHAVEIATRYLGEDFYDTEEGRAIVKCYLTTIDPSFQRQFIDTHIASFLPLLRLIIRAESERRKMEKKMILFKMDPHRDPQMNCSYSEILQRLEACIGSFRLQIFSEESGTCIASHHTEGHPISASGTLTMSIFDRSRKYRICIDRGSSEGENQFSQEELREIIYPFLKRYIQRKEITFFDSVNDNMAEIDSAELRMKPSRQTYNYSPFFARVMVDYGSTSQLHDDREYLESLSQAIDICRSITLASLDAEVYPLGDMLEEIDRILGGKIHRKVLHIVTSLLLSRNETLDGTGYPYGLSKKNIPLQGRIYTIIRAYEALLVEYSGNHNIVLSKMSEWAEMGYFDPDILKTFLLFYGNETVPQMKKSTGAFEPVMTPLRRMRYESYLTKWQTLLGMMRSIEDGYMEVRKTEDSGALDSIQKKAKRSELFLVIKKLQGRLREEAGIRKIIYLTRHGKTISDDPGGPPGSDDEILTEVGEMSGRMIGENMRGLHFHIRTSPLPRAVQYAEIICQNMRGCIKRCLDCPYISIEEVLINPDKSRDTERYGSLALKIRTDTEGLPEYLVSYISSSDESMILWVSHRDILVQLRFWIENLFRETYIEGKKYPFGNDEVIEIHVQGGHVISEEEQKSRGILFSLRTWKTTLSAVREMTESVFGEVFLYEPIGGVNLIELHREFLDFLDFHKDHTPDKMSLFLEKLEAHPSTQHFGKILQSDGFLYPLSQEGA